MIISIYRSELKINCEVAAGLSYKDLKNSNSPRPPKLVSIFRSEALGMEQLREKAEGSHTHSGTADPSVVNTNFQRLNLNLGTRP